MGRIAQMRKIKITEGQNFSIHVEEKIEKESFFFHEYEMAVKYLNNIWDSQAAFKWSQNDLFIENPNNIISFCGERGTGKSSVMISFINALHQSEKKQDELRFSAAVRNNNWDSTVIIDPSMFDGVHNIVDVVLAHIFQSFNDAYQKDNQRFDMYERERLYKLMTKVYKSLSIIKNKEKMLDDEYDEAGNISKLQKLGESTQLKETLSELISVYLEMISKVKCKQGQKCEKLLIAVDDLDLCNEHAYEMAEQIRKYLILPNVIIFIALKIEQLKLGIEEKNRKDFKNIVKGKLNSDAINYEISDMSQRYLTKLIPTARRILLPDLNNTEFTLEFDRNIEDSENLNCLNAEEIILKMIREKTGMIFETTTENTYHYFVLENLREFVNFVIFLSGLNTPEKSEQVAYLQNLQDFKIYFINEILKVRVKEDRFTGLKEVLDCDYNTKNFNMRVYLNQLLLDFLKNNNTFSGNEYEYPMTSFAAVADGLNSVAGYLTKKEDYQLLYFLRVYYTIILNQRYLENKDSFPYELIGGFIWGSRINTIMPSSRLNNGGYLSRGRFTLDIQECWKIICKEIPMPKPSLDDEIIDVFRPAKNNQLYVRKTKEDDKWRQASAWILMAALVSGVNYGSDGKSYIYDGNFIYDNHTIFSVNVSPSIENYFGALCTMARTVEKASLQLLGLDQKDVDKILQIIITKNEKKIKAAQTIAVNPDLSMRLLEYCQKNGECRDSEGESRTYQLYKRFFRNVQLFLQKENLESVDMSTLWMPTEKLFQTGEEIDICKICAEMYEKQKSILNLQNNNTVETQKMKQIFAAKVANVAQSRYSGNIDSIPGNLRNKTVEWVKKKLDNIANYIQNYTYENKCFPIGFDSSLLINLYSDVVDLYVQDQKAKISEEQHKIYQKIAQVLRQSSSK